MPLDLRRATPDKRPFIIPSIADFARVFNLKKPFPFGLFRATLKPEAWREGFGVGRARRGIPRTVEGYLPCQPGFSKPS